MDSEENQNESDKLELTFEQVFVNLKLISKIEIGDKLIHTEGKFINIDRSMFPFLTRWFQNVNRTKNVYFINNILNNAFNYNDKLIDEQTEESASVLFRLTTEFKNTINGLSNLRQTYCYDKLVQSEIDVMIENIRNKVEVNSKALRFLHK